MQSDKACVNQGADLLRFWLRALTILLFPAIPIFFRVRKVRSFIEGIPVLVIL